VPVTVTARAQHSLVTDAPVLRSLLASLGVLAGVVHLALVPSHWGEWRVEGAAFAVVGWGQLALALACWLAPTRRTLVAATFLSLASVGAWAVTRTSGSPWGPHAWHAESVTGLDAVVVAAEVAIFLLCAALLVPAVPRRHSFGGAQFALLPPVVVAVLTSALLASPSARNHAHDAHGGHGEPTEVASGDHTHSATAADDAAAKAGADAASTGHADHTDSDDHTDSVGHTGHATAEDDRGLSLLQNGHQHGGGEVELDLQTSLRLGAQLVATLDLVERYPTVADAAAAGFRRAGPFSPGLGTHYLPPSYSFNSDGDMDPEDMAWPTLIFDGWEPDAPIAGFMYQANSPDGAEPEGFVGPNDHWHYHTDVCIVIGPDGIDAPLGADRSATKTQCDQFGGMLIARTGYMVHVWTVPGYESDLGIFSEVNPAITCPDGTYFMKPVDEYGLSPTVCRGAV
jgi:hypothetical protein